MAKSHTKATEAPAATSPNDGFTMVPIVSLLTVVMFFWIAFEALRPRRKTCICTQCGTVAAIAASARGSFTLEVFLWFCFIVPGLFYSLWRMTGKRKRSCPECDSENVVPEGTPRFSAALKEFHPDSKTA